MWNLKDVLVLADEWVTFNSWGPTKLYSNQNASALGPQQLEFRVQASGFRIL